MAIAPTAFHPARTTGLRRLRAQPRGELHAHQRRRDAQDGQQYWHARHAGRRRPEHRRVLDRRTVDPDSLLAGLQLKARKGLALRVRDRRATSGTSPTRRSGSAGPTCAGRSSRATAPASLGYLPDIAIGGGVRTLGGSPKFFLTTVGIDAQISKPIALDDSAVLTPYVGAQRLIIFADSTVVDLTPSVDPLQQCGYRGHQRAGQPQRHAGNVGGHRANDGMPIGERTPTRLQQPHDLQKARIHRWRGIAGLTTGSRSSTWRRSSPWT